MKKRKNLFKRERYQNHEEWFNARAIGGTDASAILGKNRWKTQLDVFKTIRGEKKEQKDNETFVYGRMMEEPLANIFAINFRKKYQMFCNSPYEIYRRQDKPFLTYSPDRLLREYETGRRGILECKTHRVRNNRDLEEWYNHLPDEYYCQNLHGLVVLNTYEFVWLIVKLLFENYDTHEIDHEEIRYYYIERKDVENEIEYLEIKETDFYNNSMKGIIPTIKL